MKKFILFAGVIYYPKGGWNDFQGTSDDASELVEQVAMSQVNYGWWQIVDTSSMTIIKEKKPLE